MGALAPWLITDTDREAELEGERERAQLALVFLYTEYKRIRCVGSWAGQAQFGVCTCTLRGKESWGLSHARRRMLELRKT